MTKTKKEAILKDKENLPQEPVDKSSEVLKPNPKDSPQSPQGPQSGKIEVKPEVIEVIQPTGDLKRLAFSGLNWWMSRRKDPLLEDDEKGMLEEPLDRLEAELLRIMPQWLREQYQKSGPFAGPALEIGVAVLVIMNRRRKPKEPPKPEEKPAPTKQQPPQDPAAGAGGIVINTN
jgi:hypothetical protein